MDREFDTSPGSEPLREQAGFAGAGHTMSK